jgi:hypothetical protein
MLRDYDSLCALGNRNFLRHAGGVEGQGSPAELLPDELRRFHTLFASSFDLITGRIRIKHRRE